MNQTSRDEQLKSVWFLPTLWSLAVSFCCSGSLQYLSFGGCLWHPLILAKTEKQVPQVFFLKVYPTSGGCRKSVRGAQGCRQDVVERCFTVCIAVLVTHQCVWMVLRGQSSGNGGKKRKENTSQTKKKSLDGVNAMGGGVPGRWLLSDWCFREEKRLLKVVQKGLIKPRCHLWSQPAKKWDVRYATKP